LRSIGIAASLERRGHDVTRLSVHTDGQRRAILELPSAGELGRGAMTLPRGVLRLALLQRLSELGTDVEWQTRLVKLEQGAMNVHAHLVQNARLDASCIDREAEYVDLCSELVDAQFVVGADGPKSTVREALGIEWIPRGPKQFYAFFEAPDEGASNEAQLAIHDGLGSCIYPFQSGISRFSFEVTANMQQAPDPTRLRQLLDSRMPWYTAEVAHVEWSGHAELSAGLAARFGEGRVLLTGDAAHATGPLGGQSLNVGMFEANELALRIIQHFARPRPVPLSVAYGEQRSLEWNRLFGLYPSVPATGRAADWVKRNITVVLPNLPASGDDLDDLLDQMQVASA
jgi:2-polyprenyl-6-methoxyphenol hydroxylase-like FAD-dependent oxidoreductase